MKYTLSLRLIAVLFVLVASLENGQAGNAASSNDTSGSGTSSVMGRVRLEGTAPAHTRINMATDPSCAKAHAGAVVSDDFVVGSDGSLGKGGVSALTGLAIGVSRVPARRPVSDKKDAANHPMVLPVGATRKSKWRTET